MAKKLKLKPKPTLAEVTRERDALRDALRELNGRASQVADSVCSVDELMDELHRLTRKMERAQTEVYKLLP